METSIEIVRRARTMLTSGDADLYDGGKMLLQEIPPDLLREAVLGLEDAGEISKGIVFETLLIANQSSNTDYVLTRAQEFSKHTRHNLCLVLQEIPRPEAFSLLKLWAQSDLDPTIRAEACWALGSIVSPESEHVLSKIAQSDHDLDREGTKVSRQAEKALSKLHGKDH